MESQNITQVPKFLLLGLSDDPDLQRLLFGMFLFMYTVTVCGNLLIILIVSSNRQLHTPMYFFLSNLSLIDIGFTSTTIPKMLHDIYTTQKTISYAECLIQLMFFNFFGCMDSMLITSMAYDRFVAICHPLHYSVIMNPRLCGLLVLASSLFSFLDSQLHYFMVSQLIFCGDVEIPSFFCDPPLLLNLACSDTSSYSILVYCISGIFAGVPALWVLFSYARIVSSVLRVSSSGGKYKAFSTCASHLSVVCLFYGTGIGVYISSAVVSSHRSVAMAAVMYILITPMLNPFIYSLRNKDIKRALKKLLSRKTSM
ncbi:olfactory receptor 7E178-like [Tenrec ecaudatus]|uniref:olfactory receptor 7E178-like n=1 Tax=Tenrec ecaudatus TaxID=94439 RepID=UPI003F596AF8